MKEFHINENDSGQRVDKFVTKVTVSLPKSLLYKYIRTKKIKVNRKRCQINQILEAGDLIQLFLPPDFFAEEENTFRHLTPKVTVIYEDENLLICDKPIGVSCHSDAVQKSGTLIDHIKAYLYKNGEFCPDEENSFAPALCNRIDRNTSGLVICAKNAASLREMNRIIRDRELEKDYLAWANGILKEKQTVTLYLKKDSEENRVRISPRPQPGFLTAVTEISPITEDRQKDRTLLKIRLHTGRTHQIRATLSYLGHPLVGDAKYGKNDKEKDFSYQALRAWRISFFLPEASPLSYLSGKEFFALPDPLFPFSP